MLPGDGRGSKNACCGADLQWKTVGGTRVYRMSSGKKIYEARCGKCGSVTELEGSRRRTPPPERAKQVAAMPHVRAWIAKLEKLGETMPKELYVFSDGSAYVMVKDEHGQPYLGGRSHPNSPDQDTIISNVKGHWDGGGW